MRRFLVIYNPRSGNAKLLGDVKAAFAQHGVQPKYMPLTAKNLARTVRSMRGATVVAAGGDGTVSTVANELFDGSYTLGIIPAGTLNHFAGALNIPTDAAKAVKAIVAGKHVQVDVSTVNKRVFINNSSIGFYPRSLRLRNQYDKHIGKWPAAAIGIVLAALRPRHYRVQLMLDGKQRTFRTPFVFISNNPYKRTPPDFGERTTLTGGQLGIYIIKTRSAWGLLRMLAHAVFTKKRHTSDFVYYAADTCTIHTVSRRPIRVACDGEVVRLHTPLKYKSQPKSLRVIGELPR